jgi:hypothetical protein
MNERIETTIGSVLLALGAVAIAIGSIGPWARASIGFLSASKAGTDGDGVLTLCCAIGILLFAALASRHGATRVFVCIALLLGVVASAIAFYDIVNINDALAQARDAGVDVSVGWGILIVAVGGLVVVVGALLRQRELAVPNATELAIQ